MDAKYAKGEKPRDLDAAQGGLVLERHQNWAKNEIDDMHPLGTGMLGPGNTQGYAKGTRPDKEAVRKGDNKSLPLGKLKPRC